MEEIKLLNNAFKIYNLNTTPDLSNNVLDYIFARLIANRENFETMIEMLKENISFDDILNAFKESYRENDYYKKSDNYVQGPDYYSGSFPVPIGNIVVETNDVLEVIKYFVRGIKSRNTITISQTEYYDLSLSNMVLIIFVEALAKFNISRNTLMIMPFEECFTEEFDEVIEIEDVNTNIKQKEFSNNSMIYVENHIFDLEVNTEVERLKNNNIEFEVIEGSLDDVLDVIRDKKPKAVSIYTQDPNIAYEFITLANSQNVFVNSSLLNAEKLDKKNNLYYKKKVMYPSEQKFDMEGYYKEYENQFKEIKTDIFEKEKTENKEENTDNKTNINEEHKEVALAEVVNPWYKRIFEKIKKLFSKEK